MRRIALSLCSLLIVVQMLGMPYPVDARPTRIHAPSASGLPASPGMNGIIAFSKLVQHGEELSADVFTIKPDGGGIRNLTDGAFFQGAPTWSPDGRHLLYFSNGNLVRRSRNGALRIVVPAESSNGSLEFPWTVEFSPDGTKLVYCEKNQAVESGEAKIMVSRSDGSGARTIVELPGVTCQEPPSWSPDGKSIVFARMTTSSRITSHSHIWIVGADGSDARDLTPSDVQGSYGPTFLTDGRILFQSFRACSTEPLPCGDIFSMAPDGSDVERVTFGSDHPGIDYMDAEASPDERLLVVGYRTTYQPGTPQEFGFVIHDPSTGKVRDLVETSLIGVDWQPRCTVRGTASDDVLVGTSRRDLICGLGGDDVIKGLGGDDVLFGHGGNDQVLGGTGRDIVVGNSGRDRCDSDPEDLSRVC